MLEPIKLDLSSFGIPEDTLEEASKTIQTVQNAVEYLPASAASMAEAIDLTKKFGLAHNVDLVIAIAQLIDVECDKTARDYQ